MQYIHSQAKKAYASGIIPFSFSSEARAIGITRYKNKDYLVATSKSNEILRLYGQCKSIERGLKDKPAASGLVGREFFLKVSNHFTDRSDYYSFIHLRADERAKLVSGMNKGRSGHKDSVGRN